MFQAISSETTGAVALVTDFKQNEWEKSEQRKT
jgi:hypothetical protein